jgi:hypothetical protein
MTDRIEALGEEQVLEALVLGRGEWLSAARGSLAGAPILARAARRAEAPALAPWEPRLKEQSMSPSESRF